MATWIGERAISAEATTRYQVDWASLLDEQSTDFLADDDLFDSFEEARAYVLEGLEVVIERLTGIRDQVGVSERFNDLESGMVGAPDRRGPGRFRHRRSRCSRCTS